MNTSEKQIKVYNVELEQLVEGEKQSINSMEDLMNAKMDITVGMGSSMEKIGNIVNLKIGDVITLDKSVEEILDINVNGKLIASGESIIIDDKLAIRLIKISDSE